MSRHERRTLSAERRRQVRKELATARAVFNALDDYVKGNRPTPAARLLFMLLRQHGWIDPGRATDGNS